MTESQEDIIRLQDIEALVASAEERARLEHQRLTELQEIRQALEWLKAKCAEGDKARARIEQGIHIIVEYLGAQARGDREAMRELAKQAKEVTVEVQSGGVRAKGDVAAGRDVAGRDKRGG